MAEVDGDVIEMAMLEASHAQELAGVEEEEEQGQEQGNVSWQQQQQQSQGMASNGAASQVTQQQPRPSVFERLGAPKATEPQEHQHKQRQQRQHKGEGQKQEDVEAELDNGGQSDGPVPAKRARIVSGTGSSSTKHAAKKRIPRLFATAINQVKVDKGDEGASRGVEDIAAVGSPSAKAAEARRSRPFHMIPIPGRSECVCVCVCARVCV